MALGSDERKAMRDAWLTEVQAIANYQAECAVLRRTAWTKKRRRSLELFEQTLAEEMEHRGWFEKLDPGLPSDRAWTWANRRAGSFIGVCLSLIPSRLSWYLHHLAELKAEAANVKAGHKVTTPKALLVLKDAAQQEKQHSRRFLHEFQGSEGQ